MNELENKKLSKLRFRQFGLACFIININHFVCTALFEISHHRIIHVPKDCYPRTAVPIHHVPVFDPDGGWHARKGGLNLMMRIFVWTNESLLRSQRL